MRKERSKEKVVTSLATSVAAVATAAGAVGVGAAGAALLALGPATIGMSIKTIFDARGRSIATWWEVVARLHGHLPDELSRLVEARADEPKVAEVIVESTRHLLQTLSDAVIPALAALTADYLQGERAPDRFFRNLARMLADLDATEFEELSVLLLALRRYEPDGDAVAIVLLCRREGPPSRIELGYEVRCEDGALALAGLDHVAGSYQHGPRLVEILKAHGLAEERTKWTGGQNDPAAALSTPDLARLLRYFRADP